MNKVAASHVGNSVNESKHDYLAEVDQNTGDGAGKVDNHSHDEQSRHLALPISFANVKNSLKGNDEQDNDKKHVDQITDHGPALGDDLRVDKVVVLHDRHDDDVDQNYDNYDHLLSDPSENCRQPKSNMFDCPKRTGTGRGGAISQSRRNNCKNCQHNTNNTNRFTMVQAKPTHKSSQALFHLLHNAEIIA